MKKILSEDGYVEYTLDEWDYLSKIKIMKLPDAPYTVNIPQYINNNKIYGIGHEDHGFTYGVWCIEGSIQSEFNERAGEIIHINIDDKIEKILDDAFECVKAKSLHWPAACLSVPEGCFYKSEIGEITGLEHIQHIEDNAFSSCNTAKVSLNSKSIKYIGYNAFSQSKITEFTWPEKCTTIPAYCFENCSLLTMITNINSVKTIAEGAFEGCKSLTKLDFPEELSNIENYAFAFSGLKQIDLSGTVVEHIGKGAFAGLSEQTKFIYNTVCPIEKCVFEANEEDET